AVQHRHEAHAATDNIGWLPYCRGGRPMKVSTNFDINQVKLDPVARDRAGLHAIALASGLESTVFPQEVLLASRPGAAERLVFRHVCGSDATLATGKMSRSNAVMHGLLSRARIPARRKYIFDAASPGRALSFAARLGYPV